MSETEQRAEPYVLAPGETRREVRFAAGEMWVHAGPEDTAGALSIFQGTIGPNAGPPLHVHDAEDEALLVLEGELTVQLGDQRHIVGTGGFVWMPRGVPHAFANLGTVEARALGINTPGGIERMFTEQADYLGGLAAGEAPDPQRLGEISAHYGNRVVGPPLTASE